MKTCTMFVATACVAALSIDSAYGYAKFLDQIPNGNLFSKSLGHTADAYTEFGSAFSGAGSWTTEFCHKMFPGTQIENGAAFGDPCCTWKAGAKPDKTITAWTDKPTIKTECASAATPAPAATTAAPAATPATPVATTAAPAGKPTTAPAGKPTTAPAATTAPPAGKPTTAPAATTAAPAGKPTTTPGTPGSGGKPSGKPSKCGVKTDKPSKENKSLEDEEEYNDDYAPTDDSDY